MKKSLIIISILCLLSGADSYAQSSANGVELNNKLSDSASVPNKAVTNVIIDTMKRFHSIDYRSTLMFGFKGGLNESNVYNGLAETRAEPLWGWVAGAFMSIPLSKYLGLEPEVLYAEKGFVAIGTVSGNNYTFRRKTIYLDVPLLLQYKPTKSLSLLAGPVLSLPIETKDDFDPGPITNEQKQVIANGVIPQNFLGGEIGADVYIQKVVASIRAGWDLQTLNDDAVSDSRRYQNFWIQATVGYMFK